MRRPSMCALAVVGLGLACSAVGCRERGPVSSGVYEATGGQLEGDEDFPFDGILLTIDRGADAASIELSGGEVVSLSLDSESRWEGDCTMMMGGGTDVEVVDVVSVPFDFGPATFETALLRSTCEPTGGVRLVGSGHLVAFWPVED